LEKDKFDILFEQIEAFKNKYYLNTVFKGSIYFVSLFLSFFLIASLSEYYFEFSTFWRRTILFGFIGANIGLFVKYLGVPLYKMFGGKGRMSTELAAKEIGVLIPEISDKLLNTIQLKETNSQNYDLILASLEKRTKSLLIHRFSSSIRLSSNKRKFRYFIIPMAAVMAIVIWDSNILLKSTERLLDYENEFEKVAPFQFSLENESLVVLQGESLEIDVELMGSDFPSVVKILSDEGRYSMVKKHANSFSYKFNNINESFAFKLEGNGFRSKEFNVIVIPKPRINELKVELDYPDYLNRVNETVVNNGDLIIPEGTVLKYKLRLENISEYSFQFMDTVIKNRNAVGSNLFVYKPKSSQDYEVAYKNDQIDSFQVKKFSLDLVRDQYPKISVSETVDSSSVFVRYFEGVSEDDYGLRNIKFYLRSIRDKKLVFDTVMTVQSGLKFNKTRFFFNVDFSGYDIQLDDDIEYYFVVWDNDGVNGSKSTKSKIFKYNVPNSSEFREEVEKNREKVEDDLKNAMDKLKDYEKKVDKLKNNFLNREDQWKNKKLLEDVMNQREELNQDFEDILNEFNKNESFNEQFDQYDEEIQQKKEKIEDLLENLMDDEMMKLLEEMQNMLDDENKNLGEEELDQLEMDFDKMKEEMDNTLEMLKRMDIEKGIEDKAKQLDELAQKQKENAKKTEDKKENNEDLLKEQQKIQDEYNEVKKDLEDLKKKNEELSSPMDMEPKLNKDANEDMNKSKEELDKDKNSKSSKSQKSAAEKMQDDAEALKAMLSSSSSSQNSVDMEALRDLLENVIRLSFEQESLLSEIKNVEVTDPKYLDLVRQQRKIIDDNKIVKDSLNELMKRVPVISSTIGKEVRAIDMNLSKSLNQLEERKKGVALSSEQYVMTSYNNIALLLSEALEQMQEQMKSKMSGNGSCNNPGGQGQKPSSGNMSMQQMKDALKKQLEEMKKGKSPGGKSEGDQKGLGQGKKPGEGMTSKQIAKMAAEQGAIRKSLEKLRQKKNADGSGNGNKLNDLIKELEQMEEDLVNKRFNTDLIKRQQTILTRLLEHEKAERERDFDNKRKSNSGKNKDNSNLKSYLEYKRKQEEQIELIKTLNPELRLYYKSKANEYFNTIEN
jgi:hypothetical protein